jgi:hypothetical protein
MPEQKRVVELSSAGAIDAFWGDTGLEDGSTKEEHI